MLRVTEIVIKRAERLLPQPIAEAEGEDSNLGYHADRGEEAFWHTVQSCLQLAGPGRDVKIFMAAYLAVLGSRRKDFEAEYRAIDPDADRG